MHLPCGWHAEQVDLTEECMYLVMPVMHRSQGMGMGIAVSFHR
jgi:hypothetical protein